jgi:branched-subunit amino acid ABC-type transport system permease component
MTVLAASADTIVTQVLLGVARGGLIFLVAIGLTLTFGALRIVNLAHGCFYLLGAYFAFSLSEAFGAGSFWLSLLVAPLGVALVAAVLELTVMRRLYAKDHLIQILATFALLLIATEVVRMIYGADPRGVAQPEALGGSVGVGGVQITVYSLFTTAIALALGVALILVMTRSNFGRDIRAAVSDPEMLSATGANVGALFFGVFVFGAWMAGLAGVIVAPAAAADPGMGHSIIIVAFAVTVIGGLGSVRGAAIAAVAVGIVESLGILYFSGISVVFVFALMVAVLAVRPTGLFGLREETA